MTQDSPEAPLSGVTEGDHHGIAAHNGGVDGSKPSVARCPAVRKHLFLILLIVSVFVGFTFGLSIRTAHPGPDLIMWIGLPGEVYMRILKSAILPLIVCCIINGTSTSSPKSSGWMGVVCVTYIVLTNILSCVFGVVLGLLSKYAAVAPTGENKELSTNNLKTVDILADFIRNLFPENIVASALQQTQTKYVRTETTTLVNVSGQLTNVTTLGLLRTTGTVPYTNVLGLIVYCSAVGITASKVGKRAAVVKQFFQSAEVIFFKLFDFIKWTTPMGVASLVAKAMAEVEDVQQALMSMGWFVLITAGGSFLYQVTVLPLIYWICLRKNPVTFYLSCVRPAIIGFGPPSSAVPYAEMMRICLDKYRVDPRVPGFVLPFCTTLNRDGSCMFIAATCLYIVQTAGISLDVGFILYISMLSVMSSFALPAIPMASLVAILIILGSVGIPPVNIGLILAVEWLTDRIRTTTNVVSHMTAVLVTWRFSKHKLDAMKMDFDDIVV